MRKVSHKESLILILFLLFSLFSTQTFAQENVFNELVKYEQKSSFIKEFKISLDTFGLKGITSDSKGNAWIYHSTNDASTILKLEPETGTFRQYVIEGKTISDDSIINLAGGMLVFDSKRNVVWFTDARTNSIGKLDVENGKIELIGIPTPNSGVMGIALSPDSTHVWFSEIVANKVASLEIASNTITEYPTGEQSGPSLITFDSKGTLWATLSYSQSILRLDPESVGSDSKGILITKIPETFSPFGIALVERNGIQQLFVSDHGSSKIISFDPDFQSFTSYWTSQSQIYPTTLPGQIIADKFGNIYFPQHGGNRISKFEVESNLITEYDIPTGPLSTVLFIAVTEDGSKLWFTEVASNKVAYLDTTISLPFRFQVKSENQITLEKNMTQTIDVIITKENTNQDFPLSLSEVEVSVVGMSESGLEGIIYSADPPRLNLEQNQLSESKIELKVDDNAKPGQYHIMVKASAIEKGQQLLVSQLYPISLILDVPKPLSDVSTTMSKDSTTSEGITFRDITNMIAMLVAAGLVGFLIYSRIKKRAEQIQN